MRALLTGLAKRDEHRILGACANVKSNGPANAVGQCRRWRRLSPSVAGNCAGSASNRGARVGAGGISGSPSRGDRARNLARCASTSHLGGECTVCSWLFAITRNKLLDECAGPASRAASTSIVSGERSAEGPPSESRKTAEVDEHIQKSAAASAHLLQATRLRTRIAEGNSRKTDDE